MNKLVLIIVIIFILFFYSCQKEHYADDYIPGQKRVVNTFDDIADYYREQAAYINSLSDEDRTVIDLYAGNYFFRAINSYQQGSFDFEQLPDNWAKDVNEYCETVGYDYHYPSKHTFPEFLKLLRHIIAHLNQVILNAPPITAPIQVCRGSVTSYFVHPEGFNS